MTTPASRYRPTMPRSLGGCVRMCVKCEGLIIGDRLDSRRTFMTRLLEKGVGMLRWAGGKAMSG